MIEPYKDCFDCVHFVPVPCGCYCNKKHKSMSAFDTEYEASECADYDDGDIPDYLNEPGADDDK